MPHEATRAETIKAIIPMIMKRFNCDEDEALMLFSESNTGECYADDSTGLYKENALHIFSLLCDEFEGLEEGEG